MKSRSWKLIPFTALVVFALVLGACAPAAAPAATTAPAAPAATTAPAAPAQPTAAPVEPTAVPAPAAGGNFIYGTTVEPDTLDAQKTGAGISDTVLQFIGGSLIVKDPDGKYAPSLAESWTASEDGLVWEFKLREDVKFHNGDPLTAEDFVWSYQRAVDPATASPATGPTLASAASFEAPDTYTFRITLAEPFFPILEALSDPGYMQPLNKRAVEEGGDNYGRSPVGVGPFKLKEWSTGEMIVLERNPDYTWYPPYAEGKEWKLDTIEFRVIPEYATVLAGLEAGEIDFAYIDTKDLTLFKDNTDYIIFEGLQQGLRPYMTINNSKPPFDNLDVRKAFNYAIDREGMIALLTQGNATPQMGPLTESQIGYSDAVESLGYSYDLEKAKEHMAAAGYTPGSDGILQKDGQPFELTLYTLPVDAWVKAAEYIQQNLTDLGVKVEIVQEDQGVVIPRIMGGDYEASMMGMTYTEADVLYLMFHSANIGALNLSHFSDPTLDEILARTRTETDPAARQAAVDEAQKYIVEQAVVVPLYIPINFYVMNARVKDGLFSPTTLQLYLEGAYIEE